MVFCLFHQNNFIQLFCHIGLISVLGRYIKANFSRSFFLPLFMNRYSWDLVARVHHLVTFPCMVISHCKNCGTGAFRSQDVAPPFDKPRLIGKLPLQLYRQMHVLSLDWISVFWLLYDCSVKMERVSSWDCMNLLVDPSQHQSK